MDFLCHQCSGRLVLFAFLYLSRNEKWWTMVFLYAILLVCECSSSYMCFFTSILYLFTASYHFVATWHAVSPSCFIYFILDWFVYYPSLRCNFLCYFHVEHTIILMRKWNALGFGNQTKVLCLQQRTIKIVLLLYIVLPIIWCFMGPLKSYMCMFSHYKL